MRTIGEWIGHSDDARIPNRVRVRRWIEADGRCECCGHKIMPGERWDIDHRKRLKDGGEHRESNLRVLCIPCHSKKTAQENRDQGKANRIFTRHIGIKKPRTIRAWRKFDGTKVFAPRER